MSESSSEPADLLEEFLLMNVWGDAEIRPAGGGEEGLPAASSPPSILLLGPPPPSSSSPPPLLPPSSSPLQHDGVLWMLRVSGQLQSLSFRVGGATTSGRSYQEWEGLPGVGGATRRSQRCWLAQHVCAPPVSSVSSVSQTCLSSSSLLECLTQLPRRRPPARVHPRLRGWTACDL